VHDLITHCLRIYRGVDDLVRNGSWDGLRQQPPETGTVDELDVAVRGLVDILGEREPEHEVPNWSGSNFTARFWRRRMAQETAVHRWDVQFALGDPDPVEVELAVDGIDEILDVFLPRVVGKLPPEQADLGGSLHVHATDSEHGEWIVKLTQGDLLVGHAHEKADAAVRGTASDLLLLLWGRDLPAGRVQVLGDGAVVDRWRERIRI
jgi:uncharacterized protein (TIGR03083 family)